MNKLILGVMVSMLLLGCEIDTPDETTRCTTNSYGDTTCRTYYNSTSHIDCENGVSCKSSGMTANDVAVVYDSEDSIIDIADEVVVVETTEKIVVIDIQ